MTSRGGEGGVVEDNDNIFDHGDESLLSADGGTQEGYGDEALGLCDVLPCWALGFCLLACWLLPCSMIKHSCLHVSCWPVASCMDPCSHAHGEGRMVMLSDV